MLSTSPRELPADGEDTPSLQSGYIGVYLLGDFYLLDIKVEVYCPIFFIKLDVTHENVEWPTLGDFLYVIGCSVMGYPSSCKLKANFLSYIQEMTLFICVNALGLLAMEAKTNAQQQMQVGYALIANKVTCTLFAIKIHILL